jgi:hypothetical protein
MKIKTNSHIDLEELAKEKMMIMTCKGRTDKGDSLVSPMIKIKKMKRSITSLIERREYLKEKKLKDRVRIEQKELRIFLTQTMKMMEKTTKCRSEPKGL